MFLIIPPPPTVHVLHGAYWLLYVRTFFVESTPYTVRKRGGRRGGGGEGRRVHARLRAEASSTERGVMEELQLSWKRLGGAMWSGTSLFCCWRSHGKVELRPPSPLPPIQPSRAPAPVSYYKMAAEAPPLLRTDWTLHGRIYHRVREVYRDGVVPCRVFVSCWGGNVASFDSKHGSWESKYFQLSPLWHQCCLLRECCLTPPFCIYRICRVHTGAYFNF